MVRLIAAVLIDRGNVVQTREFRITNIVGNVDTAVKFFASWDVDEIALIDISREPWDGMLKTVERVVDNVFLPVSVGGKIRTLDRIRDIMLAGGDKIIVRDYARERPAFVTEVAEKYGSQAICVGIDVGADHRSAAQWANKMQRIGAGEILLNSTVRDGTKQGFDLVAIETVSQCVSVPVIALGGAGKVEHFAEAVEAGASAVAAGNLLHYSEHSTIRAKQAMIKAGIKVRESFFNRV